MELRTNLNESAGLLNVPNRLFASFLHYSFVLYYSDLLIQYSVIDFEFSTALRQAETSVNRCNQTRHKSSSETDF